MLEPERFELSEAERLVDDAAAGPELHVAARLLDQVATEVLVGGEEDLLVLGNGAHDALGVAGGADPVALGLHLRRAIDVADGDGARKARLPRPEAIRGAAVGERAA